METKKLFKVISITILALLMILGTSFASKNVTLQSPIVSASTEEKPTKVPDLPNIHVVGTGGTIAGVSKTETSFQDYRAGQLDIQKDMVDKLPNLDEIANVTTTQFGNKGSSGYSISELYDLSLLVDKQLKQGDGVVVTTGTDTMEEIAYFLDLTIRSPKPVVVTGSMRPWTVISDDAKANLFNGIKLAASDKTKRFGTVVMLNDEIYAARDVTKTNSYRLDTFDSSLGLLGYIDEDHIQIYRGNARTYKNEDEWNTPFDLNKISKESLPKVEIAYSYQNAGGEAIDAFVDSGAKGIVTAGTGAGGVSSEQRKAMSRAISNGVIFLKTTRTGSGNVYDNSEGIISADNLSPQHARIFLLLSLAFSDDYNTIAKWMEKYGAPQVASELNNEEPELEIDEPIDQLKTNRETITVKGTAVDESLDWVKVNNKKVVVDDDGSFSMRVMLKNGKNKIKVTAQNETENKAKKTVTVLAKFDAPAIDNLEPKEDLNLQTGGSIKIEMNSEPGLHPTFSIRMPLANKGSKNNKVNPQNLNEFPMMETEKGHYVGYWTVPSGLKAKGAEVKVMASDDYGNEAHKEAKGKLNINVEDK